jgi:hypothetical protein
LKWKMAATIIVPTHSEHSDHPRHLRRTPHSVGRDNRSPGCSPYLSDLFSQAVTRLGAPTGTWEVNWVMTV